MACSQMPTLDICSHHLPCVCSTPGSALRLPGLIIVENRLQRLTREGQLKVIRRQELTLALTNQHNHSPILQPSHQTGRLDNPVHLQQCSVTPAHRQQLPVNRPGPAEAAPTLPASYHKKYQRTQEAVWQINQFVCFSI